MSVIVVVQGTPDPEHAESLKQYQDVALPVIQKHGGVIVTRGRGLDTLAGNNRWSVAALLRFPDIDAVHAWNNDPDYRKVIALRTVGYAELEINVFQE